MKRSMNNRWTRAMVVAAASLGLMACEVADDDVDDNIDEQDVIDDDVEDDDQFAAEDGMIDILWTVDNTGTACTTQDEFRQGVDKFIDELADTELDFHLGVTTTHMYEEIEGEDYFLDLEAAPGQLQSAPDPVPGNFPGCLYDLSVSDDDLDMDVDFADITPLEQQLEAAIACTEEPDQWDHLTDVDGDEVRCATRIVTPTCNEEEHDADEAYCLCPDGDEHEFTDCIECAEDSPYLHELFPPADAYRDLPTVFRADDYRDDGQLDVERLRDDFRCMTLVGSRGDGFTQGLAAAVKAVSPEMTGGPDGAVEDVEYPNAGFLRPEAHTGLVFYSTSNDCSYGDNFERESMCGTSECTIQEHLGDDGALLAVDDLAGELVENIAASRGLDDIDADNIADTVLPASVYGDHLSFEDIEEELGAPIPASCPDEPIGDDRMGVFHWTEPPACAGSDVVAWSGRRYEQFLDGFDASFGTDTLCANFAGRFGAMAEFFDGQAGQ